MLVFVLRAPSGRCLRPLEIARFEAGRGLTTWRCLWMPCKFLSLATHLLVSGTGHGRAGALAPTRHRSAGIKTRGRAGPKPTTHGGRPACRVEPAAVCGTVLVSYLGGAPRKWEVQGYLYGRRIFAALQKHSIVPIPETAPVAPGPDPLALTYRGTATLMPSL